MNKSELHIAGSEIDWGWMRDNYQFVSASFVATDGLFPKEARAAFVSVGRWDKKPTAPKECPDFLQVHGS